jgi:hypothetical protein
MQDEAAVPIIKNVTRIIAEAEVQFDDVVVKTRHPIRCL